MISSCPIDTVWVQIHEDVSERHDEEKGQQLVKISFRTLRQGDRARKYVATKWRVDAAAQVKGRDVAGLQLCLFSQENCIDFSVDVTAVRVLS